MELIQPNAIPKINQRYPPGVWGCMWVGGRLPLCIRFSDPRFHTLGIGTTAHRAGVPTACGLWVALARWVTMHAT